MKKSLLCILTLLPLVMSGCNLFGGLSSPSSDPQYLDAARACLDQGDYSCAMKNYQALSSSYNDVQVSEESLTTLAEYNIFSISDLVASLGSNLGSSASFAFLANALEQRGITNGADRTIIKSVYDNDSQIQNAQLEAFSKFLAALAMFNEVLANAVGSDGTLTAADIVIDPTGCKNGIPASCAAPTGTALTYDASDTSSFTTTGNGTGVAAWSGAATLQKLITAGAEAADEYSQFTGSSSDQGLLVPLQTLKQLPAGFGDEACRELLLQVLDL